jgi:hypothetical protein
MTIPAGTDHDGALRCPACGSVVATLRTVTRDRGPLVGGTWAPVPIGHRWSLADGFVPAKGHHPGGLRWYVSGGRPSDPGPELRFGAFVATCGCGAEVEAPAGSPMLMDSGGRIRRVRRS